RRTGFARFARRGRRRGGGMQQAESIAMPHDVPLLWIVAPAQREHVAAGFSHDGLVPALIGVFKSDHEVANADLLPISWQVRWRSGRLAAAAGMSAGIARRRRRLLLRSRARGGSNELVVQVATNEWHEHAACGMDAADR